MLFFSEPAIALFKKLSPFIVLILLVLLCLVSGAWCILKVENQVLTKQIQTTTSLNLTKVTEVLDKAQKLNTTIDVGIKDEINKSDQTKLVLSKYVQPSDTLPCVSNDLLLNYNSIISTRPTNQYDLSKQSTATN